MGEIIMYMRHIKTVKGCTYFVCLITGTITMFFTAANIVFAAKAIKMLSDNSLKSYGSLQAGWVWALVGATIASDYSEAHIDVKPGNDHNSINLCSKGSVPVAIFGSDAFDVFKVDIETLRLTGAAVKDAAKKDSHAICSYEDLNDDFIADLICLFTTRDIAGIDEESTSAELTGEFSDGTLFRGTDSVYVVKEACD